MESVIKNISNNWLDYRKHCESISKTGAKSRTYKPDHIIANLVEKKWVEEVGNIINRKKYSVKSSLHQGNIVATPWLVILDKKITETPQEEYYIAYLFSRSGKKIYLTLAIGATQFELVFGNTNESIEKMKIAAKKFQESFEIYKPRNLKDKIDLLEDDENFEEPLKSSSRNLVRRYEAGTCFVKEYKVVQVKNKTLIDDLTEFIDMYQKIVEDPNSENFKNIAESLFTSKKKPESLDYVIPKFESIGKKERGKIKISSQDKKKRRTKGGTKESRKTGRMGEKHVYKYEYNKLKKKGLEHLSKKIKKHCENREYPGYDFTSYDENGNEIYIEVKATKHKIQSSIIITDNEWNAAKDKKDKYYIYLVNNVYKDIKIYKMIENVAKEVEEKRFDLLPYSHEIEFRKK